MKICIIGFFILSLINCSLMGKSSDYDSALQKQSHAQKDIVNTLRSVANLDKDDFTFLSDKMKNVIENYKFLQKKISGMEKKMNLILLEQSRLKSKKNHSDVQISTGKISLEEEHFSSDDHPLMQEFKNKSRTNIKEINEKLFVEAQKLYSEKSWQNAITKFQEYKEKNPNGSYLIESIYYVGESFKNLKMQPESEVFYKEIIQHYPYSFWAAKAKEQLKK